MYSPLIRGCGLTSRLWMTCGSVFLVYFAFILPHKSEAESAVEVPGRTDFAHTKSQGEGPCRSLADDSPEEAGARFHFSVPYVDVDGFELEKPSSSRESVNQPASVSMSKSASLQNSASLAASWLSPHTKGRSCAAAKGESTVSKFGFTLVASAGTGRTFTLEATAAKSSCFSIPSASARIVG